MEGLSINEIKTFEDVVVTYTPSSNVYKYSYTIIKNGEVLNSVDVGNNELVNINFNEQGSYKIEIVNYDIYGISTKIVSGEYIIDKVSPVINVSNKTFKIKTNEKIDYLDGVSASDNLDGDLTTSITTNIETLDFSHEGVKVIEYSVVDSCGNIGTNKAFITVKKDNSNIIKLGQLSIFMVFIIFIIFLYKYIRSIKLEKRFSNYTVNSSKNSSISLFDNLYNRYNYLICNLSNKIFKSKFLLNVAKRYNKYDTAFDMNDKNSTKFMARKFILGFIFIIISIIINIINFKILSVYEIILSFVLGFYTLDVIYMFKFSKYKKKIDIELLDAVTIMNNAFKAGMSIMQAIDLVSHELSGPISKEFKKISLELSYGLDIEVAFKRFSDRIKSNEAIYLTSSLSILNKSGGNIIKVFNSIEKTMFNKRKLEQELKSLTSSSRFVMYVLIIVPLLFSLVLMIINPEYFKPLFENPLGILIFAIMIFLYVTYIFVVRRAMKIRM